VIPQTVGPVSVQPAPRRPSTCAPRRRSRWWAIALASVALGLVALVPGQAGAATFAVTKTADTDDGVCDADCSLREAVRAAYDAQIGACPYFVACSSPAETVAVPPGTYLEPLGALVVNGNGYNYGLHGAVSVVGAGPAQTVIDAQLAHRAVEITFGSVVQLRQMTIRNGSVGGSPQGTACDGGHFHGAAVHNHGDLTMENITITGSVATTDNGGALASGTCSGSFNSPSPCPIGRGACATLTNVTITGNRAAGRGGGIFSGQALSLTNVTVADNAAQQASGIYSAAPPADCTTNAGPVYCARPMTLVNTIVSARGSASTACAGTGGLASLGNNLFTDGSCASVGSDLVSADPLLSGLQIDGTLALLPGSPAVDTGTNNGCPATDERGAGRPQHGVCDIGAYERRWRWRWWRLPWW
jgi:CSLREA domain-containing protein